MWPLKKIKNLSSFHPMLSFRINSAAFVHSNIGNTLRIFSGFFFLHFILRLQTIEVKPGSFEGLRSPFWLHHRKAEGSQCPSFVPLIFRICFISISPSLSLILSNNNSQNQYYALHMSMSVIKECIITPSPFPKKKWMPLGCGGSRV